MEELDQIATRSHKGLGAITKRVIQKHDRKFPKGSQDSSIPRQTVQNIRTLKTVAEEAKRKEVEAHKPNAFENLFKWFHRSSDPQT